MSDKPVKLNKPIDPELVSTGLGQIENSDLRKFFHSYAEMSDESLKANIQQVAALIPYGNRTGTQIEVEGASFEVTTSSGQTKIAAFPPKITVTLP